MKHIKFTVIILAGILSLNTSCSVKREYASLKTLAHDTIRYINRGEKKSILEMCISKREYIKEIHEYTDAANPKSGLPAEDFWRIFIVDRRKAAIQSKIRKYKDSIIEIRSIGKPEKIYDYKKFKMLRKIPITMLIKDDNDIEIEITDNQILGSVIEKNGTYRLLNIFR